MELLLWQDKIAKLINSFTAGADTVVYSLRGEETLVRPQNINFWRKIMNLNRLFKLKFLLLLFVYSFKTFVYPAFENIGIGARPAGLAGAYTALGSDAYSLLYNPGGIGLASKSEISAQYNKLYVGLTDNSSLGYAYVGGVQPIRTVKNIGCLGIGYLNFSLEGLYSENTLIFGFASPSLINKFSLGVNLKYLTMSYGTIAETRNALGDDSMPSGQPDKLFAEHSNSLGAVSFDVGLLYYPVKNYRFGLTISDLNTPNISLAGLPEVVLPQTIRLGVAHFGETYSLAAGLVSRADNFEIGAGGEKYLGEKFVLRGGVNFSNQQYSNLAVGFGFVGEKKNEPGGFNLDYALLYPLSGVKGTLGSHQISVTMKFGPPLEETRDVGELREKLEKEQKLRQEQEKKAKEAEKALKESQQEVERLRQELNKLLKIKPAKEVGVFAPSPVTPPVQPEAPTVITDKEKVRQEYQKAWAQYQKNSMSMNLPQRVKYLEKLLADYRGVTDTSSAQQEYTIMKQEWDAQNKYYRDSLTFYRKMVDRGVSKAERISILQRMIKKYGDIGIDVSDLQKELKMLQEK